MGVELTRAIPCVDYAVIGEGDRALPELLAALSRGEDAASVVGVVGKSRISVRPPTRPPLIEHMDSVPIPDYAEFFERADRLGVIPESERRTIALPFESSRGCWWGAKKHCTFCGLNGSSMKFRSKSPERLVQELALLSEKYGTSHFEAVDNILDISYLNTVFARLTSEGAKYDIFYEIKSNLTREQIRALAAGGVVAIQPGIESLSSNVLTLMRKGVTGVKNVNTLRWAHYYGIDVTWSLLWGFPGETADDYDEQIRLMRKLTHLQPPKGVGQIWMERYSPIYFDRVSFPAKSIKPEASYAYVYPPHVDLDAAAYFFEYELEDVLPPEAFGETLEQVHAWQEAWKGPDHPSLEFSFEGEALHIIDRRNIADVRRHVFSHPLANLYSVFSDRPRCARSVKRELGLTWSEAEIEKALDEFCVRGLMMSDGGVFLSLALPRDEERPSPHKNVV
jgi:ribosomal peptide maturation radical SAM protein 1